MFYVKFIVLKEYFLLLKRKNLLICMYYDSYFDKNDKLRENIVYLHSVMNERLNYLNKITIIFFI